MNRHRIGLWLRWSAAALVVAGTAWAGSFGRVIPIGGQAADIALDEARGALYIANFTANRIEVLSLACLSFHSSMNVAPQPGALALSPDGQYLVVAHFGNFQSPNSPSNGLTVIDLNAGTKQSFTLGSPPLGLAFGADDLALVVTSTEFLLFDPVSGSTRSLDTIAGVTARTLPVPPANFPPQIIAATVAASGDGLYIYGLTDTIRFSYDVVRKQVRSGGYGSSPALGPRVISVSRDGSYYTAGWGLFDSRGKMVSQFINPSGALNVGSHAIDSDAGIIYAQVPEPGAASAVLGVYDADNLTLREQLQLRENLAGHAVLNANRDVLYAVSESGAMILPVGALNQAHRLAAQQEDLVFRGNFCDKRVITQQLTVVDPGGGSTDFALEPSVPGITVAPASGMTPAVVQVRVDPSVFQAQKGTVTAAIQLRSTSAVNIPVPVRVLINNREPDQRGTFINVPGKLVDVLADPVRNRFYVLRQDKNQVLVFDGATYDQIAALRTSNVPTRMAITFDRHYLLVGHDDAQLVQVYDLETLETEQPIIFPSGHYPRSLAVSGNAILAAVRNAAGPNMIDRIDFAARTAAPLPSLGIFENKINIDTVLVASPNGSSILAASADGNVMLYSASSDTFTVSRKDFPSLAGSYAASSFDQYLAGNNLLNSSLVLVNKLESGTGASSGFAFVDQFAFRTTAGEASGPGVVQRVDLTLGQSVRPTRMAECPPASSPLTVFTRTLAPLYDRSALISLTISGFTVLPWNYDAAVAPPRIAGIVNAADGSLPVAPGGLVSIYGSELSPVNLATREIPLPTALGDSCLTVNGVAIPMLFVSSSQINAQLPFNVDGRAILVLRTPGGVSDNYNFTILPAAPSVFRSGSAGPETGIPTLVRALNNELVTPTNPIHPRDEIVIFATGLGRTSPAVDSGMPAPSDPLPVAIIPPQVTLGGTPLNVNYAGLAPGEIGVYQINATVPDRVPLGMSVPLVIDQGGSSTTLDVRVVQ
ncbi:MAG: hypothetical protein M1541_17005 [Acidobacteria bacterium]|nr:hypothetical protein [Acidobacteriota bacterium]